MQFADMKSEARNRKEIKAEANNSLPAFPQLKVVINLTRH